MNLRSHGELKTKPSAALFLDSVLYGSSFAEDFVRVRLSLP